MEPTSEVYRKLLAELDGDGEITAIWTVPKTDKIKTHDIADAYAVVRADMADCGVIVYGYSERLGQWLANWSARWVVRKLLEESGSVRDPCECGFCDVVCAECGEDRS